MSFFDIENQPPHWEIEKGMGEENHGPKNEKNSEKNKEKKEENKRPSAIISKRVKIKNKSR